MGVTRGETADAHDQILILVRVDFRVAELLGIHNVILDMSAARGHKRVRVVDQFLDAVLTLEDGSRELLVQRGRVGVFEAGRECGPKYAGRAAGIAAAHRRERAVVQRLERLPSVRERAGAQTAEVVPCQALARDDVVRERGIVIFLNEGRGVMADTRGQLVDLGDVIAVLRLPQTEAADPSLTAADTR